MNKYKKIERNNYTQEKELGHVLRMENIRIGTTPITWHPEGR